MLYSLNRTNSHRGENNLDYTWFIFFIIFVILLSQQENLRALLSKLRFKKIQKKRGKFIMTQELINKLVGKDAYIFSVSGNNSSSHGIIQSITDGWIELKTKAGQEYINIDYVTGIMEKKTKK